MSETDANQTQSPDPNHKPNGDFAVGNKIGNRFAPGESGNPLGRRNCFADIRRELLDSREIKLSFSTINKKGEKEQVSIDYSVDDKEKTIRHAVMIRAIGLALAGDTDMIEDLQDREDGKPRQAVDLGGQKDNPLHVISDTDIDRELERLRKEQTTETEGTGAAPGKAEA